MRKRFDNQTIVVTGATRGIGKAIAAQLLREGATVIGTGTRQSNERAEGIGELEGVHWHDVDLSSVQEAESFCSFLAKLERIDACINNAGINRIKVLDDITAADYDVVHSVNQRAPFLICQAVAGRMRACGGGRILNVASIWSEVSKAQRSLYSASKTALVGMTRALSAELGSDGILINSLSPGFVLTDLTRESLSEEQMCELADQVPLKRLATPEEIAEVACFLVSDSNRYLTGQNIIADGGFTIV
ncbi:SDR family oxidoreductase [Pelagicoccus sp. SDUM812005]|uniref:SDR family NAD(P)-dependent oxidoreductase n=1 Tax=Pelagicoccus sp. SDUM812005 TaxID=3041257 RepID=UPI00280FBEE6|nr:SDR family oxidoreductase [Pelagicoccus sp. SDUM812005]MDQ8180919.1 SDR family NAD(P)-dependent oxidoreductase [Pelagicoccus sp. SDUM812005]